MPIILLDGFYLISTLNKLTDENHLLKKALGKDILASKSSKRSYLGLDMYKTRVWTPFELPASSLHELQC